METKLKYQIDKLVKAATVGAAQTDVNPLSFKPNPSGLVSKVADAPASDDEDGPAVYQPPKLSAVPYRKIISVNDRHYVTIFSKTVEDGPSRKQDREERRVRVSTHAACLSYVF